jgi:hypothetical protein
MYIWLLIKLEMRDKSFVIEKSITYSLNEIDIVFICAVNCLNKTAAKDDNQYN